MDAPGWFWLRAGALHGVSSHATLFADRLLLLVGPEFGIRSDRFLAELERGKREWEDGTVEINVWKTRNAWHSSWDAR